MNFFFIGIDYKRAPIEAREAVYKKRREISEFLSTHYPSRAAILYTCNRFEVYGLAGDIDGSKTISDIFQGQFSEFLKYGYAGYGRYETLRRLLRLAIGLESQIKGETQILQQLAAWARHDGFPVQLAELLHEALFAAGDIRRKAGLEGAGLNIADLVYRDLSSAGVGRKILDIAVAGTGNIAGLFAEGRPEGTRIYFAAHKNFVRAEALARRAGGLAVTLRELPGILAKADVLVSATSSPHLVFDATYLSRVLPFRRDKLYIYDLAIPRDVDPAAGDLSGIILKNMDDLTAIFECHNMKLDANIKLAEYLVEEKIDEKASEARREAQPVGR